jgi:hypothetical protein
MPRDSSASEHTALLICNVEELKHGLGGGCGREDGGLLERPESSSTTESACATDQVHWKKNLVLLLGRLLSKHISIYTSVLICSSARRCLFS